MYPYIWWEPLKAQYVWKIQFGHNHFVVTLFTLYFSFFFFFLYFALLTETVTPVDNFETWYTKTLPTKGKTPWKFPFTQNERVRMMELIKIISLGLRKLILKKKKKKIIKYQKFTNKISLLFWRFNFFHHLIYHYN